MRFDFIAYDSDERPTLIVEALRRFSTSEDWAVGLRRNILAYERVPPAPYFAVVTPDALYLWETQAPPEAPPGRTDMRPVLEPYFTRIDTAPEDIEPRAFEEIVGWWLENLADGTVEGGSIHSLPPSFIAAVRGGHVRREVPA